MKEGRGFPQPGGIRCSGRPLLTIKEERVWNSSRAMCTNVLRTSRCMM